MMQAAFTLRLVVEGDDLAPLVANPDVLAEMVGVQGVAVTAMVVTDPEMLPPTTHEDMCSWCFGDLDYPVSDAPGTIDHPCHRIAGAPTWAERHPAYRPIGGAR